MTDKVLSLPTGLEVRTDCIEVHYVKACKRALAKVVRHRVIQNPRLTQQLYVGFEVVDDCQPSKCTPMWRKHSNISLCELKRTKFHRVAHTFFQTVVDDGQMHDKLQVGGMLLKVVGCDSGSRSNIDSSSAQTLSEAYVSSSKTFNLL